MRTKLRSSTITERRNKKEMANPFHPGEVLHEEFLVPLGLTQIAFANKLSWTPAKLNELIRGRRGITAESAIALSDALGTSPKFWMNLQASYDLHRVMSRRHVA
jgi:antitoxin HigA-1